MIRRVQLNISQANTCKLETLDKVLIEAQRVVNLFIDLLWDQKRFTGQFVNEKVDTWLSVAMQQNLGKQALGIVKTQRKRRKKTKPIFNGTSFNFSSNNIKDIRFGENTFDFWIRLWNIGDKILLNLPAKLHKHYHRFMDDGWLLKKTIGLRKQDDKYFIDLYFEKDAPQLRTEGSQLGCDIGYKKLLAFSDSQMVGEELESVYEKISRRKQGSKAFKRSLIERDQLINQVVNQLDFSDVKELCVENLKCVKHKSKVKKRVSKKFMNKLQRWSYPKVLVKLSRVCEEVGILFTKVNPAYTSQTCSVCGHVDKNSRRGEQFLCTRCSYVGDADVNAAINILHRGVYSLSAH